MSQSNPIIRSSMKILSGNIRGFRTNIGELTHNYVLKSHADIVFVSETFLDDQVPHNFATIPGYSPWHRNDRNDRGGGVALCYRAGTRLQILQEGVPDNLELILFRYFDATGDATLAFGCYRPPWQGTELTNFIRDNLDRLILKYKAKQVIIIGDLNPRSIQSNFDNFLTIHNLTNHVDFPTHVSGSSLDPVISDLCPSMIKCSPMGFVGTSDHTAILAEITFKKPRPEKFKRCLWKWETADWIGMNAYFRSMNWENALRGDAENKISALTTILHEAQSQFVPCIEYEQTTKDQPWFGPRCRAAAKAKYRAWRRYKQHPTRHNKARHCGAARHMQDVQDWSM